MNRLRLSDTNLSPVKLMISPACFLISNFQDLTYHISRYYLCLSLLKLGSHLGFLWTSLWIFHCFLYSFLCLWLKAHSWTMTFLGCLCLTIACQRSCLHCSLVENLLRRTKKNTQHTERMTLFLPPTRESWPAQHPWGLSVHANPCHSARNYEFSNLTPPPRSSRLPDVHPRKFACDWSWESGVSWTPLVRMPPINSPTSSRTAPQRTPSVQFLLELQKWVSSWRNDIAMKVSPPSSCCKYRAAPNVLWINSPRPEKSNSNHVNNWKTVRFWSFEEKWRNKSSERLFFFLKHFGLIHLAGLRVLKQFLRKMFHLFSSWSLCIFSFIFPLIFSLLFHLVFSFLFHLLSLLHLVSSLVLLLLSSSLLSSLLLSFIFSLLSSLLLSCLVSLSLSSFSLCLRVMLCVVLCGVCRCAARWKKRGKTNTWIQKTSPCVHSKRPVYAGTMHTCVSTCARGAGTHGGVLNVHKGTFWIHTRGTGGHRQFCLLTFAHVGLSRASEVQQRNPCMLPIFSLRIGPEQHVPRFPPIIRFPW